MNHTKTVTTYDSGGGIFTTADVQAQKERVSWFLMGQKHRSWRAFFTPF